MYDTNVQVCLDGDQLENTQDMIQLPLSSLQAYSATDDTKALLVELASEATLR